MEENGTIIDSSYLSGCRSVCMYVYMHDYRNNEMLIDNLHIMMFVAIKSDYHYLLLNRNNEKRV